MRNLKFLFILAFAFSACSLYDNYDADLMPGAVAINDDSSSSVEKSSSSEKEKSSSSEKEKSSSSEKEESSSSGKSSSSEEKSSAIESSSSEKQSSSSEVSSSSEEKSSSSSETPKSSNSDSEWICGKSTMGREGGIQYTTVQINETCWMAENMRDIPNVSGVKTICYDRDDANCEKYGRLYNYAAAERVCPSGWELPDTTDIIDLITYTDSDEFDAGRNLKATSGWDGENGIDDLDFHALPAGSYEEEQDCDEDETKCDIVDVFYGIGTDAMWWTSVKKTKTTHFTWKLFASDDGVVYSEAADNASSFKSVRCIKK